MTECGAEHLPRLRNILVCARCAAARTESAYHHDADRLWHHGGLVRNSSSSGGALELRPARLDPNMRLPNSSMKNYSSINPSLQVGGEEFDAFFKALNVNTRFRFPDYRICAHMCSNLPFTRRHVEARPG